MAWGGEGMEMPLRRDLPSNGQELHERALQRDPLVMVDLVQTLLTKICGFVRNDLKCDEEMAYDAAIDVLYAYVGEPERYDPRKARLVTYLTQAAKYRVQDRLRAGASRAQREHHHAAIVELFKPAPKEALENGLEASLALKRLIDEEYLDDKDVEFLRSILMGERSTEELARLLGLEHLPQVEKRRKVKQYQDRLKKRLERFGKEDPDDPA
jgi:RNA polymerase sigma-70 factor, ECF subfamily